MLGVRPHLEFRGAGDLGEQLHHRLSLIEEQPPVAGRHPFGESGGQVGRRRVGFAVRVVCERPEYARLDQGAVAACRLRRIENSIKQVERLARVTLGDQQPGEREQVVLGQDRSGHRSA